MKKILIYLSLVACLSTANAQHIRKNYNEMTSSEYSDYNAALQLLWNFGSTSVNYHAWFASKHNTHFNTNIHMVGGGQNFTSFHRFFLLHWELMLKNTNTSYDYLSLPYWDWRIDPVKNGLNTNNVNFPTFWAYSFVPITNFSTWGLSRPTTFPPGNSLPTPVNYANAMSQPPFWPPNFSQDLETNNHNGPHGWVGGTMGGGTSPLDPIFFSHHAMVDKIWQDWEDQTTGIASQYLPAPYTIPVYNIGHGWIDNLDANTCADSRNIPFRWTTLNPFVSYDVWYAENGKVLLDGANGVDFAVNGNGKIYRYTTNLSPVLGGSMYTGDIQRSGGTVIADTKGGFTVPAGTTAHFRAGGDITMLPGSSFYANAGSSVTFKIITAPNGF